MSFTAAFQCHRWPHTAFKGQTPYAALNGRVPKLDFLRVLRSRTLVHKETYTPKSVEKAWEGRLVGHSLNSRAYRVYNPHAQQVVESRNVTFIESPAWNLPVSTDDGTRWRPGKLFTDQTADLFAVLDDPAKAELTAVVGQIRQLEEACDKELRRRGNSGGGSERSVVQGVSLPGGGTATFPSASSGDALPGGASGNQCVGNSTPISTRTRSKTPTGDHAFYAEVSLQEIEHESFVYDSALFDF